MHELHLAQGILESAIEEAALHDGKHIHALRVCLGETSHVKPESLSFCLEAAAKGTIAEGARIETKSVSALGHCRKCGSLFQLEDNPLCPECGSDEIETTRRSEVFLESLELD